MTDKIPASVFIICKNEAVNIERALKSVEMFDDIVLVDSGSTDETLEIARRYPCRRYFQAWLGYARQKQVALELCKHEWALNIDADEALSPELRLEIEAFLKSPGNHAGLSTPIRESFSGALASPGTHQNRHLRFLNRQRSRYNDSKVHEGIILDGPAAKARHPILHYGESSIAVKVAKNNVYSTLRAEERHLKGRKPSITKLVAIFPVMFLKSYLIRRAYLNGWRGFVVAMTNAFYAFLKEAKLFEQDTRGGTAAAATATAAPPEAAPKALD
jgi:glycosyltransferase involved in cell wall biosynthesis